MDKLDYIKYNANAWNNTDEYLACYATAISHEKYMEAKNGALDVTLTAVKIVPRVVFGAKRSRRSMSALWWRAAVTCNCCTRC